MKIKTLFLGTGEFAVPILQELIDSELVEIVGVVTQPDKPVGRKQEMMGGPVKQLLENKSEIKVFQPNKLRDEAEAILSETTPELIIVAAYGQMVPDNMLEEPKYKALNIHGSLLPELRGAVPVQMAILNGLEKTGVTIQQMVQELDAGPILSKVEVDIEEDETSESLMAKLAEEGRDLLLETLPGWIDGSIEAEDQDESQASFCHQSDLSKDKAEIIFDTPVEVAERMVRAFYPWPVAWFELNGKRVKVFKAEVSDLSFSGNSLEVFREGKNLYLGLGDGVLQLHELQLEGKERRTSEKYLFLA